MASASPPAPAAAASSPSASSPPQLPSQLPAFPTEALVPKAETQADQFLARFPTYDGRGVLVAIFDTGCDPAASGLRETTVQGQRKYVDFIDASGSGDVDTSVEVSTKDAAATSGAVVSEDGSVRFTSPVTHRELIVPSSFVRQNPAGLWKLGAKRAFDVFPAPLIERMKKERRRVFDEKQRVLEQSIQARLARWDDDAKKAAAAATAASSPSPSATADAASSSYPASFTAKDKADLEARLVEVKAYAGKYDDCGPVMDVLVWNDGTTPSTGADREKGWWCAIDSTGTGDFRAARALQSYIHGGEHATLGGMDCMNYTVNIYARGNLVSLVTTAGSHGTHVAGIVAANETDGLGAQHNGLAPGAQLLSIKIGDSRLGSMETGTGLIRGLIEAIRARVDLINMSYGEASSIPNSGRISELIRSAIFDHGIIFVSSAGNNGPAISTAGTPGATDTGVISVGAYVSEAMALAQYSSRRAVPEGMYSWSSRGPTTDGGAGVTVAACGGAITSVCEWQLQRTQLMNGTSMSSPACAGGIALLLSGLRARGIRWTPQRIKHAIENTARDLGLDKHAQGQGLLQINAAFDHLVAHADRPELDLLYRVTIPATNGRGIYLRDALETSRSFEASIQIEPVFKDVKLDAGSNDAASKDDAEQKSSESPKSPATASSATDSVVGVANLSNLSHNRSRIAFHQKILLDCGGASWIDAPASMMLMHGGRSFSVVVRPETLEPGLHIAEILGWDAEMSPEQRKSCGPIFRVPVTVTKPESASVAHSALVASAIQSGAAGDLLSPPGSAYRFTNLSFDSGRIHRRFVQVPEGASFVDVSIRMHSLEAGAGAAKGSETDTSRAFMVHLLYLQVDHSFDVHENNNFFTLTVDSPTKDLRMDVRPGQTLEVCLAQYWSSLGACAADVDVSFHGLVVDCAPAGSGSALVLDASAPFTPLYVRSVLRSTKLAPTASVKQWNQPLKPSSASIVQLSPERDLIVYGSRLISALNLSYAFELKEDSSSVKVRAPALNDRLYESVFESQMTQIFDANKRFCFATDAFESGKALKAGKYTARIQVRHDDQSLLEKLKDMVVVVESSLSKSFDLSIYASYPAAATGGAKFGSAKVLRPGKSAVLYLSPPDAKSFPSWAKPGEWGSGSLQIQKQEGNAPEKGALIAIKMYAPAVAAATDKTAEKASSSSPTTAAAAAKKPAAPIGKPAEPEQDPAFPRLEQNPAGTSPPPVAAAAPAVAGPTPSASPIASAAASSSSAPSSLSIELRDLTIDHLSKLKKDGDVEKKVEALRCILPPLLAQFPSHLPLLFLELRLAHEVNASRPRGSADRDDAAVSAKAAALLSKHIDQTAVLAHFGRLLDKDDSAGQTKRKEMEAVRSTIVKTLALQLDMAAEELRATFSARVRSAEFQPSAIKEIDAAAAAAAAASSSSPYIVPSDDAFAQSLACVHALLAEIGGWADVSSKDQKKALAPVQTLLSKLGRQYGALWKQISTDLSAATTGGDASLQQSLTSLKIDLLSFLAQREPAYAHLAQFERDWSVVRFPKEFGLP